MTKAPMLDEQESNFTVEATDRKTVHVFSNDPVWQRRLEALGIQPTATDEYGRTYTIDLANFIFSIRRRRVLTDEQRAQLSERMMRSIHGADEEDDTEE